jgi:hypothetical protein
MSPKPSVENVSLEDNGRPFNVAQAVKFEGGEAGSEKGSTELVTVLRGLVENKNLG